MREKVGELYAELGIEDLTPMQLDRAERDLKQFHDKAEAMGDVRVQVDADGFDRSVGRATDTHRDFVRRASDDKIAPGFDPGPLLDGADRAEGDLGARIRDWATSLGVAAAVVGGVIGKELYDGFVGYAEREASTDRLAAALGLTPAEQERYGRIAGEVYGQAWGESVDDVTRTMRFALNQGLIDPKMTDDQVEAVTGRLSDMATLYEQDVSRMASAIGTMLRTGMADDVWEAMDILTVGLQGPANKADDLMDTFEEYSTLFRALGIDGPTALGLLTQAIEGGARNSDVAADALKEFGIRGKDGSEQVREAYKLLGIDATKMTDDIAAGGDRARDGLDKVLDKLRDVEDPVERNRIAVALFGTKAEDLQAALDNMDPTTAVQGLDDIAGAAETASETANDNLATSLESLKRRTRMAIENYLGTLWEVYQEDGIDGLTTKLGEDFAKLGEWWEENGEEVLQGFSDWWSEYGSPLISQVGGDVAGAMWDAFWEATKTTLKDFGTDVTEIWNRDIKPDLLTGLSLADDAVENMWKAIPNAFVDALNDVIFAWNSLEFTLPTIEAFGMEVPGSGATIGTPNLKDIPHFSAGLNAGPVPGARGEAVMALVHGGEVVMTPEQQAANQRMIDSALRAANRGGGGTTHIYVGSASRHNRDGLWERAA